VKANSQSLERLGAAFGIAGALLLALNTPDSKWGWVLFVISNMAWIAFSLKKQCYGLFVQQCVFTATSLIGLVRYF
jgi:nicotinamide riboside transporter PnuC